MKRFSIFKLFFIVLLSHSSFLWAQLAPNMPQVIVEADGSETPLNIPPSQTSNYETGTHSPDTSPAAVFAPQPSPSSTYSNSYPTTSTTSPYRTAEQILAYPKTYQQGNKYVGLSYSLSFPAGKLKVSTLDNTVSAYKFSNGVQAHAGYFVIDQVAVEGSYSYHSYRYTQADDKASKLHSFAVQGKYAFEMGIPLHPIIGLGASYSKMGSKSKIAPVVSLGAQYQIDSNWSAGLDMMYQYLKFDINKTVKGDSGREITYESVKMHPYDFNFFVRYHF